MSSSKAAASEEARRTLRYVEPSERGENAAGALFQYPARRLLGPCRYASSACRPECVSVAHRSVPGLVEGWA